MQSLKSKGAFVDVHLTLLEQRKFAYKIGIVY